MTLKKKAKKRNKDPFRRFIPLAIYDIVVVLYVAILGAFYGGNFYLILVLPALLLATTFTLGLAFLRTKRGLKKLKEKISSFSNEDIDTVQTSRETPDSERKGKAPDKVFYRIYEVIGGLSVYEAAKGLISGIDGSSPKEIVQALLFVVFILVSIQFILGTSQQFEVLGLDLRSKIRYTMGNYILIIVQAIGLLGMALSVSSVSIISFVNWYFFLLVIDLVWIFLYRSALKQDLKGSMRSQASGLRRINTTFSPKRSTHEIVNYYWIVGNLGFISFLGLFIPMDFYSKVISQLMQEKLLLLLALLTCVSAVVNFICLSALETYGK